jgi:hypothetical protein
MSVHNKNDSTLSDYHSTYYSSKNSLKIAIYHNEIFMINIGHGD